MKTQISQPSLFLIELSMVNLVWKYAAKLTLFLCMLGLFSSCEKDTSNSSGNSKVTKFLFPNYNKNFLEVNNDTFFIDTVYYIYYNYDSIEYNNSIYSHAYYFISKENYIIYRLTSLNKKIDIENVYYKDNQIDFNSLYLYMYYSVTDSVSDSTYCQPYSESYNYNGFIFSNHLNDSLKFYSKWNTDDDSIITYFKGKILEYDDLPKEEKNTKTSLDKIYLEDLINKIF